MTRLTKTHTITKQLTVLFRGIQGKEGIRMLYIWGKVVKEEQGQQMTTGVGAENSTDAGDPN